MRHNNSTKSVAYREARCVMCTTIVVPLSSDLTLGNEPPPEVGLAKAGAVPGLALQLHFCFEMGAARVGLVSSSPE